jgi:RNA polymerase sigma-70 factor (ECF subfamily)
MMIVCYGERMPPTTSLSSIYLANVAPRLRSLLGSHKDLEQQLHQVLQEAQERWPSVHCDSKTFIEYLAERSPEDAPESFFFHQMKTGDLFLACACARGETHAAEIFQETFSSDIDAALAQFKQDREFAREIKQQLMQKVLVGDETHSPTISQYLGVGDLRNWMRITVIRLAYDALKQQKRESHLDEEALVCIAAQQDGQEMQVIKKLYRQQFKSAFAAAFETLSAKERNLLRYQVLEELNFDQIGRIYHVNRSTICRWIAKIREKLLTRTRQQLAQTIKGGESELDSIVNLVQSQLDLSLHRLFGADRRPKPSSSS